MAFQSRFFLFVLWSESQESQECFSCCSSFWARPASSADVPLGWFPRGRVERRSILCLAFSLEQTFCSWKNTYAKANVLPLRLGTFPLSKLRGGPSPFPCDSHSPSLCLILFDAAPAQVLILSHWDQGSSLFDGDATSKVSSGSPTPCFQGAENLAMATMTRTFLFPIAYHSILGSAYFSSISAYFLPSPPERRGAPLYCFIYSCPSHHLKCPPAPTFPSLLH